MKGCAPRWKGLAQPSWVKGSQKPLEDSHGFVVNISHS
jgi:hypothetical protein